MNVFDPARFEVSQRVKELFDQYPKSPHVLNLQYYVDRENVYYPYWMYHFYYHNLEWIDYEATEFFISKPVWQDDSKDVEHEFFKLSSHEELIHFNKNYTPYISSYRIVLKKGFPYSIFIFRGIFLPGGTETYSPIINEEVYEALIEKGYTKNFYFELMEVPTFIIQGS